MGVLAGSMLFWTLCCVALFALLFEKAHGVNSRAEIRLEELDAELSTGKSDILQALTVCLIVESLNGKDVKDPTDLSQLPADWASKLKVRIQKQLMTDTSVFPSYGGSIDVDLVEVGAETESTVETEESLIPKAKRSVRGVCSGPISPCHFVNATRELKTGEYTKVQYSLEYEQPQSLAADKHINIDSVIVWSSVNGALVGSHSEGISASNLPDSFLVFPDSCQVDKLTSYSFATVQEALMKNCNIALQRSLGAEETDPVLIEPFFYNADHCYSSADLNNMPLVTSDGASKTKDLTQGLYFHVPRALVSESAGFGFSQITPQKGVGASPKLQLRGAADKAN